MALTLRQAADAFRRYGEQVPVVIASRLDKLTIAAQRLSVTQFMQGLGSGKNARPANPPPGPLGIRSGRLRRAVRRVKAYKEGTSWVAGLYADTNEVAYAGHETGMRPGAHIIIPVKRKALHWGGDGGPFAKIVRHPGSRIPARPYMRPALEIAAGIHVPLIESDLKALEDRILGGRA